MKELILGAQEKLNLNQQELADYLKVDRAWIVRGLNGHTTKGIEVFKALLEINTKKGNRK